MSLGVILFSAALFATLIIFGNSVRSGQRFPAGRFLLLAASFVGFFVNVDVDWWIYPITIVAWTIMSIALALTAQEKYGWNHVWFSGAIAFVGFGLFALMFAFQPAPPLAALWIVVPGLICLIPPVNHRLMSWFDTYRVRVQEDVMTRDQREQRKAAREAWLQRR